MKSHAGIMLGWTLNVGGRMFDESSRVLLIEHTRRRIEQALGTRHSRVFW